MARKDPVAPGCGIDGSKGENFTKKSQDPWNPPVVGDGYTDIGKKSGHTRDTDAKLRRVGIDSGTGSYASRDILDDVEANQNDDGGGRGIKSSGGQS